MGKMKNLTKQIVDNITVTQFGVFDLRLSKTKSSYELVLRAKGRETKFVFEDEMRSLTMEVVVCQLRNMLYSHIMDRRRKDPLISKICTSIIEGLSK